MVSGDGPNHLSLSPESVLHEVVSGKKERQHHVSLDTAAGGGTVADAVNATKASPPP